MSRYSKNGLITDNRIGKKVEPIIDVKTLLSDYLTGLNITDPSTGKPLPTATYQRYINNAISMIEHYLDISITPVTDYYENIDYRFNDYMEWGYLQLSNYPVIKIKSLKMTYYKDAQGQSVAVQEIPEAWIRLDRYSGIIRLIPNTRFPSRLRIDNNGLFFPELFRAQMIPHMWEIEYDYGFCDGGVPTLVNQAIGMAAALTALTVGGNLVLGAGIASSSISLDGLSQSINTTQSAENSSFSATIKEYQGYLFGDSKDDPSAILRILKNYYKGQYINII